MHLSETPVRLDRAGPVLGEHNHEVLLEMGFTTAEINRLEAAGVVGATPAPDASQYHSGASGRT
jgi:hypothetical protein